MESCEVMGEKKEPNWHWGESGFSKCGWESWKFGLVKAHGNGYWGKNQWEEFRGGGTKVLNPVFCIPVLKIPGGET